MNYFVCVKNCEFVLNSFFLFENHNKISFTLYMAINFSNAIFFMFS